MSRGRARSLYRGSAVFDEVFTQARAYQVLLCALLPPVTVDTISMLYKMSHFSSTQKFCDKSSKSNRVPESSSTSDLAALSMDLHLELLAFQHRLALKLSDSWSGQRDVQTFDISVKHVFMHVTESVIFVLLR